MNMSPEIYDSNTYAVLDFETTNKDYGHARHDNNRLVLGWIYYKADNDWIPINNLTELGDNLGRLYSCDFIVAHNAKFELQWLKRSGANLTKILPWCTMIGEYVRAGNRKWKLGLDATAARYGLGGKDTVVSRLIVSGVCPSNIPRSLLDSYCFQDVALTLAIFKKQRELIHEDGLKPIMLTRCMFTPVVADLELRGMHLDKDRVMEKYTTYSERLFATNAELDEITGGINMASPLQVATFMYKELKIPEPKDRFGNIIAGMPKEGWPDGVPKTGKLAMAYLKPKNKKQRRFIELLTIASVFRKKMSAYLERFKDASENDSMIYGQLNQTVTRTHRLASSRPNIQNIDRELKQCFASRHKEWKLGNIDYAQLEFRTAALLSQDKQAMEDIRLGADVHSFTASTIFGDEFKNAEGDRRKELRNLAKAHTFKPLYAGSSGTDDEKRYYTAFKKKYAQVASTQQAWLREVVDTGRLTLPTGLIVYWDARYNDRGAVIEKGSGKWLEGTIVNLPVQTFATADMATIGAAFLWHAMKKHNLKSFIINEVHDSVVLEVAPGEEEIIKTIARQAMVEDMSRFCEQNFDIHMNNVPMSVDITFGDKWE